MKGDLSSISVEPSIQMGCPVLATLDGTMRSSSARMDRSVLIMASGNPT